MMEGVIDSVFKRTKRSGAKKCRVAYNGEGEVKYS